MIKLTLGVLMALTVLTGEARAGYLSGNELYADCTSTADDFKQGICLGYIQGVMESMNEAQHAAECVPNETEIGEVQDVVVNYFRDRPENRSYTAFWSVATAIRLAWNCQ